MEQQAPEPEEQRRLLIAAVLTAGVVWIFGTFVLEPPPPVPEASETPTAAEVVEVETPTPAPVVAVEEATPAVAVDVRNLERDWEGHEASFSSFGGGPNHVGVEAYQEPFELDWLPTWIISGFSNGFKWESFSIARPQGDPVDIVHDPAGVLLPVGVDDRGVAVDAGHYRVVGEQGNKLAFATRYDTLEVIKRYELPEAGAISRYTVEFRNLGQEPKRVVPSFGVADLVEEGSAGRYGPQTELWAQVDGDVEHYGLSKLEKEERPFTGQVDWLGVGDRYFLVGLEPDDALVGDLRMGDTQAEGRFSVEARGEAFTLAPGEVRSFGFKLWTGAKSLEQFNEAKMTMASAVDFGFFGLLALPILAFLKFIFGLVGSWGVSIILLTVVIKGLLFPLSQKSYKSMKAMQTLQPEINALRERLGDDREALNREMMELWKTHGVNPMGGCLPMLVQMPIWFALYRVLWNSVELYQTEFLYFVDLSLRDPIGIFPLILGVTMWAQQKFTPNTASDATQQMVMKFMPIFFSVIMFTLPAGLVVYILINNILSILQQWIIHRQHGVPTPAPAKGK